VADLEAFLPLRASRNALVETRYRRRIVFEALFRHGGYRLDTTTIEKVATPLILEDAKLQDVDAALLVPARPFCCRTVGKMQRGYWKPEARSTVSLIAIPGIRAFERRAYLDSRVHRTPTSRPTGRPGDAKGQLSVLEGRRSASWKRRRRARIITSNCRSNGVAKNSRAGPKGDASDSSAARRRPVEA